MNKTIDVIIPVYRGLQDVIDCLDSVKSSFNKCDYELIVIDDCSPDPAVSALLKERAATGEFTLLVNEENLGFVATVNRGMQLHPERDVLLLNSDTLVVNDWLDRIYAAAYASPNVATVTPFSNNATICSYPTFCQDNELPSNTPLAKLDQLCAAVNAEQYVDVPTGVGFCMYIRRAILDKIGYFDVETFGKGYGEENDFCQRAIQAGWVNRFALDVFVQHTGNVSFGDEHNELKKAALAKLIEHHPQFEYEVQRHIAEDPAKEARLKVWLASLVDGTQPIVIHVTHNRGGGTLRFISELQKDVDQQCHSLVLMPSLKKAGQLVLTTVKFSADGMSADESDYSLYFSDQVSLVECLKHLPLVGFHFHHMLDIPHWVMDIPKHLGIPWVVSFHDYYFICKSIFLTNENGEFSHTDNLKIDKTWIQQFSDLINGAEVCITPSDSCLAYYQQAFPQAKIVRVYHERGRYVSSNQFNVSHLAARQSGQPLKVVVIGALGKIKGADILEETAILCASKKRAIVFNLIGYAYRDLVTFPKSNLVTSGPYKDDELHQILTRLKENGEVDLIWFTARCPETYSYTLSSAIEAELPIVAPGLGAFPERLAGRQSSWLLPWNCDADFVVEFLEQLAEKGSQAEYLKPFSCSSGITPAPNSIEYHTQYLSLFNGYGQQKEHPEVSQKAVSDWLDFSYPLTDGTLSKEQQTKRTLLTGLYYLRGLPILRSVVKRIPLSLQHWIRRLLTR